MAIDVNPTAHNCYIDKDNSWQCVAEDTTDLDKAMNICNQKADHDLTMNSQPRGVPDWEPSWRACRKVFMLWMKSEKARQRKELEEQDEKDHQFINKVLKDIEHEQ